ncbi:Annexin A10 [Cricetulus griseus]|uniref:Annexin A10 n=1 Tax=Cricetulus griseus TaxID=10029 RepID=G3H3B3_CRIGR|nr:Annexin A10 [Cricetulus griseus]
MLIDILTKRSNAQRQMIAGAYQSMYGRDLIADLKEQLSSHFKEVMVGLMYPPPSYDAHELWHAMKDFGFHNKTVIRILIARSEIDLMTIRKRYKERFGKSLFHDIKNFASGHYEKALLAICAGDVEDY